jgi:transketolase
MRAMPNATVLAPADATEARAVIAWAADHDGPVYLRLARDPVNEITNADYRFAIRHPVRLADGDAAVVVSTGVQSSRTAEAVARLRKTGVGVRHIHLPTIKPLDDERLLDELQGFDSVVTVEDHNIIGGVGDLVSSTLAGHGSGGQVHRIALADTWSESAPNDFLLEKYGLSPARVAATIRPVLGVAVAS